MLHQQCAFGPNLMDSALALLRLTAGLSSDLDKSESLCLIDVWLPSVKLQAMHVCGTDAIPIPQHSKIKVRMLTAKSQSFVSL